MRKYIAKIKIEDEDLNAKTGFIGEKYFEIWFRSNFQGEQIFRQRADRDFAQIDFADEKGYTYQIKATRHRSFTFNCPRSKLGAHLKAEVFVFIQIKGEFLYIEPFYKAEYIKGFSLISKTDGNKSYVPAVDLQQQYIDLNEL